jgi:AraC-like DNA-binding protein
MDSFDRIKRMAGQLSEPENFFSGSRLPENFAMPDNILCFFHDRSDFTTYTHTRYSLVFPQGKMIYFIDQKQYDADIDEMLFIRSHQQRLLHPGSKSLGRLFVTFDLPGEQEYLPSGTKFKMNESAWEILEELQQSYTANDMCRASGALLRLLLNFKSVVSEKSRRLPLHVARALEYINPNQEHHYPLNQLARKLNVSASNLRMLFRREIGCSISAYIAEQRIGMAKLHLLNSDMRIGDIAEICGYKSIYAFSAFFRKHMGISPMAYRKQFDRRNEKTQGQ